MLLDCGVLNMNASPMRVRIIYAEYNFFLNNKKKIENSGVYYDDFRYIIHTLAFLEKIK